MYLLIWHFGNMAGVHRSFDSMKMGRKPKYVEKAWLRYLAVVFCCGTGSARLLLPVGSSHAHAETPTHPSVIITRVPLTDHGRIATHCDSSYSLCRSFVNWTIIDVIFLIARSVVHAW